MTGVQTCALPILPIDGPTGTTPAAAAAPVPPAGACWITDAIHGIRPATAAILVSLISLLPGVAVVTWRDLAGLPYRTLVFTATALGMSAVLAETGALALLTGGLLDWLGALITGPVTSTLVLYWGAFAFHLLLGAQNLLVTATLPPVVTLGLEQGYNPVVFGMIWMFGTAGKIFPYQSGVLMVGYAYGYFTPRDLMVVGFLLALLESLILLLVVLLYWPLIGLV